MLRESGAL